MSSDLGEGDACPDAGCTGKIEIAYPSTGGCSCHIRPPCGWCTSSRLECSACGLEPSDTMADIWLGPDVIYDAGTIWITPQIDHAEPAPEPDVKVCAYCALPYTAHKPSTGAPWLFRLCDGSLGRP